MTHCRAPEAGGRTPSDFALAKLTQAAVDQLVGRGREVEDVYPLSPTQQGMLFHTLRDPSSGVYVEQLTFRGPVRPRIAAFKDAWHKVLERHPILRSAFVWEGLETPLQTVHAGVVLPWAEEDWREIAVDEREARLTAFLEADRARRLRSRRGAADAARAAPARGGRLSGGVELPPSAPGRLVAAAPLSGGARCYEAACQGSALHLPAPRPYRDYIAWLGQQDLGRAEAYWREALRGFRAPTSLSVGRPMRAAKQARSVRRRSRSGASRREHDRSAERFARAEGLTLNTVLQGAWALLLSRYSGEDDVVFGATVSGRAIALPGVAGDGGPVHQHAAGARPDGSGRAAAALAEALQERQSEGCQYDVQPAVQVQGWSEVRRATSAVREPPGELENYPAVASRSNPTQAMSLSAMPGSSSRPTTR